MFEHPVLIIWSGFEDLPQIFTGTVDTDLLTKLKALNDKVFNSDEMTQDQWNLVFDPDTGKLRFEELGFHQELKQISGYRSAIINTGMAP